MENLSGGGETVDHMLKPEARAKETMQKGRHATLAMTPCMRDQAARLECQNAGV